MLVTFACSTRSSVREAADLPAPAFLPTRKWVCIRSLQGMTKGERFTGVSGTVPVSRDRNAIVDAAHRSRRTRYSWWVGLLFQDTRVCSPATERSKSRTAATPGYVSFPGAIPVPNARFCNANHGAFSWLRAGPICSLARTGAEGAGIAHSHWDHRGGNGPFRPSAQESKAVARRRIPARMSAPRSKSSALQ